MIKVIKALEQKVEHLQKAAENEVLEPISDDVERIPRTNSFKCRKCNVNFVNTREMKKHKKEIHPNKNKCNHCDQNFNLNIAVEVHLKTHEEQKQLNVANVKSKEPKMNMNIHMIYRRTCNSNNKLNR